LASVHGDTYFAGTNVRYFGLDTTVDVSIVVARLGGPSIGRPKGAFRFLWPALLADTDGRLHLLWGEPPSGTALTGGSLPLQKITSVWTAEYDPAARSPAWTPPRILFEGGTILWRQASTTDGDGRPGAGGVVATVERPKARDAIATFRLKGDSLLVSRIAPTMSFAYTSLALVADTAYLALIGAATVEHGEDENSVWLMRSVDDGVTWTTPTLVSLSGTEPAHQVRVHVTPDGNVHLLWVQMRARAPMVIRHVESADGGRVWSSPDDVQPTPATFSNLRSVVDACGALEVMRDYLGERGEPHVDYAVWHGTWSAVQSLFPFTQIHESTFHRAPDGRLIFMASTDTVGTHEVSQTASQYAEKVPSLYPRRTKPRRARKAQRGNEL
jgi:hypothetical protein